MDDRYMQTRPSVTLGKLANLIKSILPPTERDLPFFYHKHTWTEPELDLLHVGRLIFSVAPTHGVFKSFFERRNPRGHDVYFIHRPFSIPRYKTSKIWRRPRIVLSSHKVFDELLTVGWNVVLAERLDLDTAQAVCLVGYKDDPTRRIGLIAPFRNMAGQQDRQVGDFTNTREGTGQKQKSTVLEEITRQFGRIEQAFGFVGDEGAAAKDQDASYDGHIRVIAIMNAFRPTEIESIAAAAVQAGFIKDENDCRQLLCLTGEPREEGIAAATGRGMSVVCVGHRTCEDWGIAYLIDRVKAAYPELEVKLIDEPEEPKKKERKPVGETVQEATEVESTTVVATAAQQPRPSNVLPHTAV